MCRLLSFIVLSCPIFIDVLLVHSFTAASFVILSFLFSVDVLPYAFLLCILLGTGLSLLGIFTLSALTLLVRAPSFGMLSVIFGLTFLLLLIDSLGTSLLSVTIFGVISSCLVFPAGSGLLLISLYLIVSFTFSTLAIASCLAGGSIDVAISCLLT